MTEPLDVLLDRVRAMTPEAWAAADMRTFDELPADSRATTGVYFTFPQACDYNAARTLLPGLASILEASIDIRDWARHDGLNRLAAKLLAKLEPKETDDGT